MHTNMFLLLKLLLLHPILVVVCPTAPPILTPQAVLNNIIVSQLQKGTNMNEQDIKMSQL
jgi:hypothetical protein